MKTSAFVRAGSVTALKLILVTCAAGTAYAAPNATNITNATEQSVAEQYRSMSAADRESLVAEATALAGVPTRATTRTERELMAVSPDAARRILARDLRAKSSANLPVGRVIKNGNAVGKVVGTAFLNANRVTLTADGKHLSTCSNGAHTHDAKTIQELAIAAQQIAKGAGRE
jgi:hypothetical protein